MNLLHTSDLIEDTMRRVAAHVYKRKNEDELTVSDLKTICAYKKHKGDPSIASAKKGPCTTVGLVARIQDRHRLALPLAL
jgi:hypothetical protein